MMKPPGIPGSPEFMAMQGLNHRLEPMERLYDRGVFERPRPLDDVYRQQMKPVIDIPPQRSKDWSDVDTSWRPRPHIKPIDYLQEMAPKPVVPIIPKPDPVIIPERELSASSEILRAIEKTRFGR